MSPLRLRRPAPLLTEPGSPSPEAQNVAALYTIEREMGFSVQTSLITVWLAATTYLTAALGILALLLGNSSIKGSGTVTLLLYALPGPACALAGYHVILFGIGLIHSKSIELLEREVVNGATQAVKAKYELKSIGSKSETAWTYFKTASWEMQVTSMVAFLVPYLSASALVVLCGTRLYLVDGGFPWRGLLATAIYAPILLTIMWFGLTTVLRGPRLSQKAASNS
jgi:hypothetical protein